MDGSWASIRESGLGIVAKVLSGDLLTDVRPANSILV